MNNKALVVIDVQNAVTKHYRDIIDRLNAAVEWAADRSRRRLCKEPRGVCPVRVLLFR